VGILAECQSGRRLHVDAGGEAGALRDAYRDARRREGDALLATIDGTIAMQAPVEGVGMQPTVVVERFAGIWPAETCGARMSTSELLDTNWVLTRLGDRAVMPPENARAPNLVLRSDGMRATGFGGCNNFQGSFELRGESVALTQMAATLRACIGGDDTEARYLEALGAATRLRQTRHHLELYGASGDMLARFEAREL
jgi:heat shock protein HslJ